MTRQAIILFCDHNLSTHDRTAMQRPRTSTGKQLSEQQHALVAHAKQQRQCRPHGPHQEDRRDGQVVDLIALHPRHDSRWRKIKLCCSPIKFLFDTALRNNHQFSRFGLIWFPAPVKGWNEGGGASGCHTYKMHAFAHHYHLTHKPLCPSSLLLCRSARTSTARANESKDS